MTMKNFRALFVLASTLLVAACASGPFGGQPGPSQPEHKQPSTSGQNKQPGKHKTQKRQGIETGPVQQKTPPPQTAKDVSSPAVMSLLKNADTLARNGQMDAAASTLERALDIDPRNPFIYQRLAAVSASQGHYGQAEQLAMKSNSLANGNPFVEGRNWRLISAVRKKTGNNQGAEQASAKAVNYQRAASQYKQ